MTLRVSDWQSESDLDSIRNSCDVFLKFLSSSESNNKSWDQLTFHTSLPNFSRTCLDILLLLINLNSDNKLLLGQFTLCVANNTLVIFSAISLSLFLLSLQPRKNDPSSSFHGFTFLEKRTIYHLSDYLPYPARVIISLIPSFSLPFFTSIQLSSIAGLAKL